MSFVIFYICDTSVIGLIVGIVLLDLAMQGIHVSNQSRVYALLPGARNRLNTVYMTVSFTGTSLGSFIGLYVWERADWKGVCVTGMVLASLAFVVYSVTGRKMKPSLTNY
jgi:predicted MFS family arabinose efflux permease